MKEYWILKGLKYGLFFLVAATAMIFGVMFLWNALVPTIFGLGVISFWQAAGLLILSRILFGGHGCGRKGHRGGRKHWRRRWESMSEEERAQMREKWAQHCGPHKHRGKNREEADSPKSYEDPIAGKHSGED